MQRAPEQDRGQAPRSGTATGFGHQPHDGGRPLLAIAEQERDVRQIHSPLQACRLSGRHRLVVADPGGADHLDPLRQGLPILLSRPDAWHLPVDGRGRGARPVRLDRAARAGAFARRAALRRADPGHHPVHLRRRRPDGPGAGPAGRRIRDRDRRPDRELPRRCRLLAAPARRRCGGRRRAGRGRARLSRLDQRLPRGLQPGAGLSRWTADASSGRCCGPGTAACAGRPASPHGSAGPSASG